MKQRSFGFGLRPPLRMTLNIDAVILSEANEVSEIEGSESGAIQRNAHFIIRIGGVIS